MILTDASVPFETPREDAPTQTVPVIARWFGSWRISVRRKVVSRQDLAGLYDRQAARWDRTIGRHGFPAAYRSLFRAVLGPEDRGDAGAALRVLDCGVGTGALSHALASVTERPVALSGIDISDLMLERAHALLAGSGTAPSLRLGDVCDLPYGNGLFDVVMAAHVLEHLPDPAAALAEMVRVLRPGGLLLTCMTRPSAFGAYVQARWRTHQVAPALGNRWLRECGLGSVRVVPFARGTACRRISLAYTGRKPDLETGAAMTN